MRCLRHEQERREDQRHQADIHLSEGAQSEGEAVVMVVVIVDALLEAWDVTDSRSHVHH